MTEPEIGVPEVQLPERVSLYDYFETEIVLKNVRQVEFDPPDGREWHEGREWFVGEVATLQPSGMRLEVGDSIAFTVTEMLPGNAGRQAFFGSRRVVRRLDGRLSLGAPFVRGTLEW